MSQIVKNHNKEKEQKIRHQSRKLEKVPSGPAAIEYESFTEMDRDPAERGKGNARKE